MAERKVKCIGKYDLYPDILLGSGQFGKVYEGLVISSNKIIAIKMVDKKFLQQQEHAGKLMQQLRLECKVMMKLNSKYVVKLYDVVETNNNYYLIQELCNLGTLTKYTNQFPDKQIPIKEANKILHDLLLGFKELISKGIIHRDIKPDNILCNMENNELTFKLADFGFARIVDNYLEEDMKSFKGTPIYAAPQILENVQFTTKCDIFSIGVLYFQCIYGSIPWPGKTLYQLITKIQTQPLQFPPKPELSNNQKSFLTKCLAYSEKDRISWDQIYQDPFVKEIGAGDQQIQKYELQGQEQLIGMRIREKLSMEGINIKDFLQKQGISPKSHLKVDDLFFFLQFIIPEISKEEVQSLFNKINNNQGDSIEYKQLIKWMIQEHVTDENTIINSSMEKHIQEFNQEMGFECNKLLVLALSNKQNEEQPLIIGINKDLLKQEDQKKIDEFMKWIKEIKQKQNL